MLGVLARTELVLGVVHVLAAILIAVYGGLGGWLALLVPFVFVVGVLQCFAGVGTLKREPWARQAQLVAALSWLPLVPLGPVAGILVLAQLARSEVDSYFRATSGAGSSARVAKVEAPRPGLGALLTSVLYAWCAFAATVTLVLGALVVTGFDVSTAVENMLDARRQKETVARIEAISEVLEQHKAKHGSYPVELLSSEDLVPVVEQLGEDPGDLDLVDAWERPLAVVVFAGGERYEIVSFGRDGAVGAPNIECAAAFVNPDCDIVLRDGTLVQQPSWMSED